MEEIGYVSVIRSVEGQAEAAEIAVEPQSNTCGFLRMDKRGVALESDKSQESVTSPSRQSSPAVVQGSSLSILVRLRRNCTLGI